jgi:hypothetical protein
MTSQLFVLESNTPLTISYSTYQKKKKKKLIKKTISYSQTISITGFYFYLLYLHFSFTFVDSEKKNISAAKYAMVILII